MEFSENYPDDFPNLSVTAYWMDAARKLELSSEMKSSFEPGCPGIIGWAEMLREELTSHENDHPPTVIPTQNPKQSEQDALTNQRHNCSFPRLEVFTSDPIIDRKSTFQAFYANVNTSAQAEQFRQQLLENNKIQNATHNMFVWKVNENGVIKSDSDEDGEAGAGGRMMHLVDLTGACDFAVIVARWYGGIHLGPDRWKHINNALRIILDEHGQIKRKK